MYFTHLIYQQTPEWIFGHWSTVLLCVGGGSPNDLSCPDDLNIESYLFPFVVRDGWSEIDRIIIAYEGLHNVLYTSDIPTDPRMDFRALEPYTNAMVRLVDPSQVHLHWTERWHLDYFRKSTVGLPPPTHNKRK
jgi:hypothetical protein